MASGLIRWAGAVVLLCGALAAVLLPPTGEWLVDIRGSPRERTPEELRRARLSSDVTEATALLARRHWVAGFREALDRDGLEDPAFVYVGDLADAAPERRGEWRRRVERETRLLPAERDGTGLAVFFLDAWHDLPGGYRFRSRARSEHYLVEGPSGPVCVVAVLIPWRTLASDEEWRRGSARGVLGPCALHATYGRPGPGVTRWLERGGYLFLDVARPFGESSGEGDGAAAGTVRGLFGTRDFRARRVPPTAQRCLTGRLEACRRWLTTPQEIESAFFRWTGTPDHFLSRRTEMISAARGYGWAGYADLPEARLVADLEAEFGSERFGRFWRSGKPMPEAFTEAFGEPPARWMHRWAVARYGEESRGPAFGLLTTVLSVLTVGATFLVGAYVAERRTVD